MTQMSESDVLVKVQVQASSDEIKDLVEVVVQRLEGVGLVLVKCGLSEITRPGQETVELTLKPALWLSQGRNVN